jgi:hypothetical protein
MAIQLPRILDHRTTVNIERAAKLRTEEGPHGPRSVRFRQTVVEPPHAGETGLCILGPRFDATLDEIEEWLTNN